MKLKLILSIIIVSFFKITIAQNYDIVVYGSSSAGVIAAVQASQMEKNVLLISTKNHIGGLTSSGLGATDINRHKAIGGLSREFYQRMYEYYANPSVWIQNDRDEYFASIQKRIFTGRCEELKMQWVFEPHVAEEVFKNMLLESGVKVIFDERLDLTKNVEMENKRIIGIAMEIKAKVFIDATYEGDLMAKAGISYTVGRESNSTYNENYNGIIVNEIYGKDSLSIDPYITKGDPSSGLLPYIEPHVPGEPGTGDNGIQAYCFRLTLTDVAENQIPITQPENFNPLLYEALGRKFEMDPVFTLHNRNLGVPHLLTFSRMPNRKTDTNHLDFGGASNDWPEGDYQTRDSIYQLHKNHHLGLLWFLKTDSRVPNYVRYEMERWGLTKDEYKKFGNFPPEIYVREARRMISDYVMTEQNAIGQRIVKNSVGLGTYAMDSHQITRFTDEKGDVYDEGKFFITKGIKPYPISYESIIPSKNECTNLLVPICLSASHAVYGSIRMEPVYMVLGQSSAIAAVLAIDRNEDLANIPYSELYKLLREKNQILYFDEITK